MVLETFNFVRILDFKIVSKAVESVPAYLYPASLYDYILHNHNTMIKTKKLTLAKYSELNYRLHSDLHSFCTDVYYLLWDPM